jgi:hypothetical protein
MSASPSLLDHYSIHRYYDRLSHPQDLFFGLMECFSICTLDTPSGRILRTSQVAALLSIISPTSMTPVLRRLSDFLQVYLLPSFRLLPSPRHRPATTNNFRGSTSFTRFRLDYFAVYASSLSLPPATQDSLQGEAGFPFPDETFTHKTSAPSPGARRDL